MEFTSTNHPPGTPEKIEVMSQRAENGLPIHHPRDVTFESGETGGHSGRWTMGDGVEVQGETLE